MVKVLMHSFMGKKEIYVPLYLFSWPIIGTSAIQDGNLINRVNYLT